MIMPSFTTLPESMLGASDIQDKFNVANFAGLGYLRGMGCGCSQLDDSGDCLDPDPCGTPVTDPGGTFTASDCAYGGTYPNCNPAPSQSSSSSSSGCPSGQSIDPATGLCASPGSTVSAYCASQGLPYNSATGLCTVPSGTTLTAAQQAALDQQIVKGGSQLANLIAAGATGATILPNGTVIGSNGAAVASTASFTTAITGMMPVILLGLLAVFALKGSR
jgi:hypothetical protein